MGAIRRESAKTSRGANGNRVSMPGAPGVAPTVVNQAARGNAAFQDERLCWAPERVHRQVLDSERRTTRNWLATLIEGVALEDR